MHLEAGHARNGSVRGTDLCRIIRECRKFVTEDG